MPDLPCTHCNGSGTEPEAVALAHRTLMLAITNAASLKSPDRNVLKAAADELAVASGVKLHDQAARIVFLEAALRDVLGHFPERITADELTSRFIKPEDLASWRDVLADKPGQLTADGSCKQHDFQPAPDDPQLGHLGVHHCTRCKSRWIPARGAQR